MSFLPLPAGFSKLLDLNGPANRSLLFDRGMDRMWSLLRELRRDHGYGQAYRSQWGRYDRDRRDGRDGRDGYRDRGRYERRYDWDRDDDRRRN